MDNAGALSRLISIGALCVAGGALCFSGLAYWNTIVSQREDREYRELSIRPGLSRAVETSDYSVRIKNGGLGPAWIKRIGGQFDGTCFVFDGKSGGFSDFQLNRVVPYVVSRLQIALREAGSEYDRPRIRARSWMRQPTALLHKDEEMIIVAIDPEDAAAIHKLVRERGVENQVTAKFTEIGVSLPLWIEYCSITEKWCHNMDTNRTCL